MRLQSLHVRSFRAHNDTRVDLAPRMNLVTGPNGAGKTNLLEAIHYLCLSKSFLTGQDANVVARGAPFFQLEGRFTGETRSALTVRMVYGPQEGKRLFLNQAPLERLADIVGQLPVVTLSPSDHALTAGGPEERRRFLDNTLSQARPAYLEDLLRYRRALRQRNALLMAVRLRRGVDSGALRAWTEELVSLGSRIVWRRLRFTTQFARFLAEAHGLLERVAEEPTITYDAAVDLAGVDDEARIQERLAARLQRLEVRERERGRTLAGPHRDELVFRLDDMEVRPYASHGQHRTFALALKLATFFFLKEELDETPLLLLDDVFGILDAGRASGLIGLLESDEVGQSILTAAERDVFDRHIDLSSPEHCAIHIVNGCADSASVGPGALSEVS